MKRLHWQRVHAVSIVALLHCIHNKVIQMVWWRHSEKNSNKFNTIFERLLHFTTCLLLVAAAAAAVVFCFRHQSKATHKLWCKKSKSESNVICDRNRWSNNVAFNEMCTLRARKWNAIDLCNVYSVHCVRLCSVHNTIINCYSPNDFSTYLSTQRNRTMACIKILSDSGMPRQRVEADANHIVHNFMRKIVSDRIEWTIAWFEETCLANGTTAKPTTFCHFSVTQLNTHIHPELITK